MQSFKRDAKGLIEDIKHIFTPDGRVDWRRMFLSEHLYIKPDKQSELEQLMGKPVNEINVTEIAEPEKYLISTLAGARYLFWLRGGTSVQHHVVSADSDIAVVQCTVKFIPNFEYPEGLTYSDVANAQKSLTDSKMMKGYISETAANRSFVRAVRGALNISIVSKEELGGGKPDEADKPADTNDSSVVSLVKNSLKTKGINNYEEAVKFFVDKGVKGVDFEKASRLAELPPGQLLVLLAAVKND